MSAIQTRCGKNVLVDANVAAWARRFTWVRNEDGYVVMRGSTHTYLHRLAWLFAGRAVPPPKHCIDHAHGKLDNRSCALRLATMRQNRMHSRPVSGRTSRYSGVWKDMTAKVRPWVAEIKTYDSAGKRKIRRRRCATEKEALATSNEMKLQYLAGDELENIPFLSLQQWVGATVQPRRSKRLCKRKR